MCVYGCRGGGVGGVIHGSDRGMRLGEDQFRHLIARESESLQLSQHLIVCHDR